MLKVLQGRVVDAVEAAIAQRQLDDRVVALSAKGKFRKIKTKSSAAHLTSSRF